MSAYHEYKVEFSNREALLEALAAMHTRTGPLGQRFEVLDSPATLFDYQGSARPQKADIVIRRSVVGGLSNDIGFERTETGYTAHISEFDRSFYNDKWLNTLKQGYGEAVVNQKAKQLGYTVKRSVVNGEVVMRLTSWR